MKLDSNEIEHLRQSNDPGIVALLAFYDEIYGSPLYEAYVARLNILNRWSKNLIDFPVDIVTTDPEPKQGEKIETFLARETKKNQDVDRTVKFFQIQPALLDGTEAMRAKLTEQEQEKLKTDKRIKPSKDLVL